MKIEKKIILHKNLLDKCRKQDKQAQFRIYELYYKAIYNTCFRLLRNHPEAEEVMQDSFLSAFNKIEQYQGQVEFGAWIKRIAINKSIDTIKLKKGIEQNFYDDTYIPEVEDDIFLIEETTESINTIRQTIELLADGYRLILSLYLIEGLDHDEISNLLGIKSSTSRSQLARAKKKLIEQLKQQNLIYKHGRLRKSNSKE